MASVVATRQILTKNHQQIKTIVLASQLRGESLLEQLKVAYKLVKKSSLRFFGYKLVESRLYNLLLTTHKIFKTKKFQEGSAKTIEDLAKLYQIPIIKTNDLSEQNFLNTIKDLKPDYILCLIAQLLRKNVFETLGPKFINAHGSYLPEYRGAAQYIFYPLNEKQQFGVTIHFMDQGLDTGSIILQKKFDYDKNWSIYRLHYEMAWQFGQMLNWFIEQYADLPELPSTPQDESKATFTRMPTKDDLKQLKQKGYHLNSLKDFLKYA